MNTLVSIIIPTYNRAHLIDETLNSILAQTYTNWECIVVDDGSTDKTADLLHDYIKNDNRFQYHIRPKTKINGPNSCRNYGFELSKGDCIKWFDSDDVMKINCLETQLDFFTDDIEVVICKLSFFDFANNIELRQNRIISNNVIYDYFCGNIAFYVSGPMWRRSFLESKSILFDESIINCDDWDFNMRMLYFKPKYYFLNQPLIFYRIHFDSLSKDILNKNFIEVLNVSSLLDKHIVLIKENYNFPMKNFYKYAIQFNKKYLLQSIIAKDISQFLLLKRVSKYCFQNGFWSILFKVWFGKISFAIIGKGSILFK